MSVSQLDAVKLLRQRVLDIHRPEFDQDDYLLRWLRARDFDLNKSERMLRDHVAWRQREKVDTILETFQMPEAVSKFYPGGFCGRDKEGSPVWIDPSGCSDPKGLSRAVHKSEVMRSRVYIMEWAHKVEIPKRSAEVGHPVHGITLIYDLEHFGMKHLWKPAMQFFVEFAQICEANYPETMKVCLIINAPAIFPIAYRFLSPFLHEKTKEKIRVLGSDYRQVLLEHIDADQLPAVYGGTMTDPDGDPRCPSKICWGGDVPESYYDECNKELMQELVVGRGSTSQLDFEVKKPGSLLQWEFICKDYDIKFGIFFKNTNSRQKAKEMSELLPSSRVNAHHICERGELQCDQAGVYVVRFDNTYSWTKGKQLWYRIEVQEPEPENVQDMNDEEMEAFYECSEGGEMLTENGEELVLS